MKNLFSFIALASIIFCACNKTSITPSDSAAFAASGDQSTSGNRFTTLLTAHPWMYNSLYFHYVDANNKGDAEYVRGASNNLLDLDDTRFVFKKDGSFTEYEAGYKYPGTWKFTNDTTAIFTLNYSYGQTDNTVVTFNKDHLIYTHLSGYHNNVYTELITAN